MKENKKYDAIIIGGSYAGLAAAMSLARAQRTVLIIDSGEPCNKQTPHSHNFILADGMKPAEISAIAKDQVLKYPTVDWQNALAVKGRKLDDGFAVITGAGETFTGRKLLFATGVKNTMPAIPGFAECWGISVLHCPYCHGYEVRNKPTGILANGDMAFEMGRLINNWTKQLTIFTNGPADIAGESLLKTQQHGITVVSSPISEIVHDGGMMQYVVCEDGSRHPLAAMYAKPPFVQHCSLAEALGCELNEQGFLTVDDMRRTTVKGIYAAGDSMTGMRAVSMAIAMGNGAGAFMNYDMIVEDF